MNELLKDRVIVVTGGAGLLGKEFVKSIAESGATAIVADLNISAAEKARDSLSGKIGSGKIDIIEVDITDQSSIASVIDQLHLKYGRIDALVNNAYPRNKSYGAHFMDVSYDSFCENTNLSLGGYFLTSQQFAKYFIRQGQGNIVNISSIYGVIAPKFDIYEGTPMTMPVEYAVIKSGLIHLTKYMANYFKGKNIRVNALSPGGILDKQPEAFLNAYGINCLNKGMLEKADLCGSLVYLLSDMSKYVNGQNLIVDDGFTL